MEIDNSDVLASLGGVEETSSANFPSESLESTPTVSTYSPKKELNGIKGTTSALESKALNLLGSGINPEAVANALGVTPSRISQLMADERFASQVTELRYQNLQSHNVRDSAYDTIEDKLLNKLEKSLPLLLKPQDILKAITVVNGAKRRGQSAPEQVTNQQTIVSLTMPQVIVSNFTTNINNQVVQAGEQSLVTMSSERLKDLAAAKSNQEVLDHDSS